MLRNLFRRRRRLVHTHTAVPVCSHIPLAPPSPLFTLTALAATPLCSHSPLAPPFAVPVCSHTSLAPPPSSIHTAVPFVHTHRTSRHRPPFVHPRRSCHRPPVFVAPQARALFDRRTEARLPLSPLLLPPLGGLRRPLSPRHLLAPRRKRLRLRRLRRRRCFMRRSGLRTLIQTPAIRTGRAARWGRGSGRCPMTIDRNS